MSDLAAPSGDVTAEYRTIREGVGEITGLRRMITVSGPDAVSFLQGLISQDLVRAAPGSVSRSFFLQPNGKLAALLWVGNGADEVVLFCDANVAEKTATALGRYRIRVKAELELDERPVTELWGPAAEEAASIDPGRWERRSDSVVMSAPVGGLARVFVVGNGPAMAPVGTYAVTAIRVEAGEPVMGVDVDESTIPQECGFIDESVSFTKGCYLGQELVARIDSRGHVNRRLMGIRVGENVVPPTGADVLSGDKSVGTMTSPCESLTVRAPIGLGLIRRELADGDAVVLRWTVGEDTKSVPATVHDLPFDDFTNP